MARILLIATAASSFVQQDAESLREKHRVKLLVFRSYPKWKALFEFIRHKIILLFTIHRYQLIICQFAGYHSFLPVFFGKLLRIPVLIICGGTESVSFPSIRYGNFHKKLLGWFTTYSLCNADHLAPKHPSLIDYDYTYDASQPPRQGMKAFIRNFNTPFTIISNGYNSGIFYPSGIKTPSSFLTVAAGMELPFTIPLKGIDLILKVAPLFSEAVFTIAGSPENHSLPESATNIKWACIKDKDHLLQLYQSHAFYLQVSMSEGFPNAVCEAMLCGCIPITSDVNALPDIVGDSGFMIHHRSADELYHAICLALSCDKKMLSEKARKRIVEFFPLSARKENLLKLAEDLMQLKS